ISGMGELHLEIIVDRMLREFAVDANVGKPQVAYRETIKRKAHGVGRFVRQSGGRGQYGHAEIDIEPNEAGKGFELVNKIVRGSSRSCTSGSPCPRNSWARSSATSARAVARSWVWNGGRPCRWSAPTCRWATCSAMPPTCGPRPRVALSTAWSFITTRKSPSR